MDDDTWKLEVTELPAYVEGEKQIYTWLEEIPDGYTISDYVPDDNGVTITNTYDTERFCLAVLKVWDDENDAAGFRPDELTVTLSASVTDANGVKTDLDVTKLTDAEGNAFDAEYKLNVSNNWSVIVTGLPIYYNGVAIDYSWSEDKTGIGKYTATQDNDQTGRITYLINSYKPEEIKLTVKKEWDDDKNREGIRPDPAQITVLLLADGVPVQKVTVEDTYTFEHLAKYANGEEIEYTVEEINIPEGYYCTEIRPGSEEDDADYVIVNKHDLEYVSVQATKIWDDNDNQDGKRGDITLKLVADGTPVEGSDKTIGYNASGEALTVRWDNLDKYAKDKVGKLITYTVVEVGTEDDHGQMIIVFGEDEDAVTYNVSIDGNAESGFTVTNSYTPETIDLSVQKDWSEDDNRDGRQPDHVDVKLLADGEEVKLVRLEKSNQWKATVKDLPKYKEGKEIVYTWEECDLPAYYDDPVITTDKDDATLTIISNKHTVELTQTTVTKIWDDKDDYAGFRPDEITMKLVANGEDTDFTVTLPAAKDAVAPDEETVTYNSGTAEFKVKVSYSQDSDGFWSATVDGLPVYADGIYQTYSWIEEMTTDMVEDGYSMTGLDTSINKQTGYTTTVITNTYDEELIALTVRKVWNDHCNFAGFRPDDITVALMKTAAAQAETEEPQRSGVEDSVKADDNSGDTGSLVPAMAYDESGKLVDVSPIILSSDNYWTAVVLRLPKYEEGKLIQYVWVEDTSEIEGIYNVVEGEDGTLVPGEPEIKTDESGTITYIINTYELKTIDIDIEKEWDDADNQDGIRPDHIDVELLASYGSVKNEHVENVRLEATGNWKAEVTDLPKEKEGDTIAYTWKEYPIDGYELDTAEGKTTATQDDDGNWKIHLVNKHEAETVTFDIEKVWEHGTNPASLQPTQLTVELYNDLKDSAKPVFTAVLSAENNWKASTTDDKDLVLPKYHEGKEITYTWKEVDLPASYHLMSEETEGNVTTLTNAYVSGEVFIKGQKTLNGRELTKDDPWKFYLEAVDGAPMHVDGTDETRLEAKVDTLAGHKETFSFDKLTYTLADLEGKTSKTFTYRIVEEGEADGVTNDEEEHTVDVKVVFDGTADLQIAVSYSDGKLAKLVNTYKAAGQIVLQAEKKLEGHDLRSGQFLFFLYDENHKLLQVARNDKDGVVTFAPITYEEKDITYDGQEVPGKTFTYTIEEFIPQLAKANDNKLNGYTYDDHVETVTVEVTDPKLDGSLSAEATYDADDAVFENKYEADGTLQLYAVKELKGRDLKKGEFSFTLSDENGSIVGEAVTNAEDGVITFPQLRYTLEDLDGQASKTLKYQLAEVIPASGDKNYDPTITYDELCYNITVILSDAGNGNVNVQPLIYHEGSAKRIDNLEDLVFLNTYEELPPPPATEVSVQKQWTDEMGQSIAWPEGVAVTVTLLADGKATDKTLVLTAAAPSGTFSDLPVYNEEDTGEDKSEIKYTVDESHVSGVNANDYYMSISGNAEDGYTITNSTATISGSVDGAITLAGTKNFIDTTADNLKGTLTDGQFTFTVKDEEGNAVKDSDGNDLKGSVKADGTISFGEIAYKQTDLQGQTSRTFKYLITEDMPAEATASNEYTVDGIKYDPSVKTVYVTIALSEDGKSLTVTKETTSDYIIFTNTKKTATPTPTPNKTPSYGGGSGVKTSGGGSSGTIGSSNGGKVKTGDDTPIMLWMIILLLAAAGIAGTGIYIGRRRRRRE